MGSGDDNLDSDKICEILHDIREAVGDTKAQCQLLPIDEADIAHLLVYDETTQTVSPTKAEKQSSVSKLPFDDVSVASHDISASASSSSICREHSDYLLEIKFMTKHDPKIFAALIEEMEANGIRLVRGHMEDFLNTDSQVIFGRIVKHNKASQIKQKLIENVLKLNGINGEMLCKKVRSDTAILPHHMRFSDLLQCATNKNNPLLSNKIQNGYEIDIVCSGNVCPHLILISITQMFAALDLDIRTIDVSIEQNDKLIAVFFVQEMESNSTMNRRNDIELGIAQIFQSRNLAATIKTKAIQMGKEAMLCDDNIISCKQEQSKQFEVKRRLTQSFDDHSNKINISVDIPDDIRIDMTEIQSTVHSSPSSQNVAQCVGITESTVIITPKHASALPPSIEKTGTTFNLIGFKKIQEDMEEIIHDQLQHPKAKSKSSSTSQDSSRSVSVIDILNNASNPDGFFE